MSVFIPINIVIGATTPLIPLLVKQLGGSVADVGVVSSTYSLSVIFASRFWGKASDKAGKRKPFIIFGFVSTTFVLLAFSIATEVWQLILLNAVMGFLLTSYIPSASMLIIERSTKERWASRISTYNFFCMIGFCSGLAVGASWLVYGSFQMLFWILSASSLIGTILGGYIIREPPITIERQEITFLDLTADWIRYIPTLLFNLPNLFNPVKYLRMIRSALVRDLPLFYLSSTVLFAGFSIFFIPLPTYFKSIGISSSMVFFLFLIHSLSATFSFILVKNLSTRIAEQSLIQTGLIIRIVAFLGFALLVIFSLAGEIWKTSLVLIISGISWAFFWAPSLTFLSKLADRSRLGEAQGTFNSTAAIGTILGSLSSGYIVTILSYQISFLSSIIMLAIGLALIVRLLH